MFFSFAMFKDKEPIYSEILGKTGYIMSYFLFTTILFFVFNFFSEIRVNYLNLMIFTLSIILVSKLVGRMLE